VNLISFELNKGQEHLKETIEEFAQKKLPQIAREIARTFQV